MEAREDTRETGGRRNSWFPSILAQARRFAGAGPMACVSPPGSVAQLDVPISQVYEMPPTLVAVAVETDIHERAPLWPDGLFDEPHADLVGEAIALLRIARDARADNILPRGQAAFVAGQDMVEIQVALLENFAAVLAGILVALEDVGPCEFDFFLRQAVEEHQHDDPRDADFEGDGVDHFLLGLAVGKVAPAREVVGAEIVGAVGENDLGVPLAYERKSPAHCADVDRLPEPIKDEDLLVQHNHRGARGSEISAEASNEFSLCQLAQVFVSELLPREIGLACVEGRALKPGVA
jgi:hypothetical protein